MSPMEEVNVAESDRTGYVEMSVFHGLFAGKIWQLEIIGTLEDAIGGVGVLGCDVGAGLFGVAGTGVADCCATEMESRSDVLIPSPHERMMLYAAAPSLIYETALFFGQR